MLLELEFKNALTIIENPRVVRKDTLIPREYPPVSHSPYRPGYDWLFSYERSLARFLEPWLKNFRHDLIGVNGIISEALSNAYCHGHQRDGKIPIEITVHEGDQGIIVRIEDSGEGFNVREHRLKFERGKYYYHLAGNGLRRMISSDRLGIFYNLSGNAFHMLHLFNQDIACLSNPDDQSENQNAGSNEFII